MRRLGQNSILIIAALIAGCGVDKFAGPSRSQDAPLLERDEGRTGGAFQFTTIDGPEGTRSISAQGVNARGDIVGYYVDANGRSHGFLLRGGELTTIDFRDAAGTVAAGTQARGVSPAGDIVGVYWHVGEAGVGVHGYLRTNGGEFRSVHYPGHANEILQRILTDGTILGCRHDNDFMASMKGIVIRSDGATSETDRFASMHNGATPDLERTVGLWTNMATGRQEGYVMDDGVFQTFVVPGSNQTAAWDVNPAGDVVGVYRTGTGAQPDPFVVHGFVRSDRNGGDGDESRVSYVSVDVPGASATQVFGINARGDVVGDYVLSGKRHGFVATRRHEEER